MTHKEACIKYSYGLLSFDELINCIKKINGGVK